jgi:hypothetical protein
MSFHMILTCFPAGLRDPYSGQPTLNRQFVAVILLSFVELLSDLGSRVEDKKSETLLTDKDGQPVAP